MRAVQGAAGRAAAPTRRGSARAFLASTTRGTRAALRPCIRGVFLPPPALVMIPVQSGGAQTLSTNRVSTGDGEGVPRGLGGR